MDLLNIAARVAAENPPTVVWRGMTGISDKDLADLCEGNVDGSGHAEVAVEVPLSKMSWWTERKGMAMAYASTDPVRPKKGWDVLMKGLSETVESDGNFTHELRKDLERTITITDVYYAMPSKDRKGALEALIAG